MAPSIIVLCLLFAPFTLWGCSKQGTEPEYSDDVKLDQLYTNINAAWEEPTSQKFIDAFKEFIKYAEKGNNECAGMVAEVYARSEPHKDIVKSYLWYYVFYAGQGYKMEFDNQAESNDRYEGKVGDFRNEAPVVELIDQLGVNKVKELDREAEELLIRIKKNKDTT